MSFSRCCRAMYLGRTGLEYVDIKAPVDRALRYEIYIQQPQNKTKQNNKSLSSSICCNQLASREISHLTTQTQSREIKYLFYLYNKPTQCLHHRNTKTTTQPNPWPIPAWTTGSAPTLPHKAQDAMPLVVACSRDYKIRNITMLMVDGREDMLLMRTGMRIMGRCLGGLVGMFLPFPPFLGLG